MGKATRKDITFDGLSNNLAETVESERHAWANFNTSSERGILEGGRRYSQIGERAGHNASDVGYGLGYGKSSGSEIQKIVVTGSPTGGTFKLTWTHASTTYSAASGFDYDCTAEEFYAYLLTLVNTGVYAFRPGDIAVTGGPFPGAPMEVEFTGRYNNTDVAQFAKSTNSLTGGTSPDVTVSTKRPGGTQEVFYAVVKHSGDTDANLYAITSSDSFATTTWTSLATDFSATDWFFQQFQDKMFMANTVDGLKYVYIGASAVSADPPSPPANAPTFGGPYDDGFQVNLGTGCTYAHTGFTTAPTITAQGQNCNILLNGTESGNAVTVTVTLAADEEFATNDFGQITCSTPNGASIYEESFKVQLINADGSPDTIDPVAYSDGNGFGARRFHFAGNKRYSRDNVDKIKFSFTIKDGINSDDLVLQMGILSNWMNDSLALDMDDFHNPRPVKATISYCMTYYRASDGAESSRSPVGTSPSVPTTFFGSYISVGGRGSTELSSSDQQFFYRQSRADGHYYRIPNLWTKQSGYVQADYGVANDPTGASDSQYDHWMDYELTAFPRYEALGFPPVSTGAGADVLGVWKQCLVVGSQQLAYLSWVGQPLRFEPPPDTPNYVSPDPDQFQDVGRTDYVSDDRSQAVLAVVGQDSLYAITGLSAYAMVGDTPALASVFRRLPGSRGAVGKRAVCRYGGGVLIGSQDGLWYYSVSNNFSGGVGQLVEREETGGAPGGGPGGVRRSYQRLLSAVQLVQFTGTADSGSFTLTFNGQTTDPIDFDATALDVKTALSNLTNVNPGDIEVFGDDLPSGKLYVRFLGQYSQQSITVMTAHSALSGDNPAISVSTVNAGGSSNLNVIEFQDEYFLFNGKSYLTQSRTRKWSEGMLNDSVLAVVANRERGLVFLTTTGKLMKFGDGVVTDAGETVTWIHESPWMVGPRARVLDVKAITQGNPTMRIYSDDGVGGLRTKDVRFEQSRFTTNCASLPGVRHKVIFTGVVGVDAVEKVALSVQGEGDGEWGS